jgi:predicted RNA-binding Zn ribbon-like protein
MSYSASYGSPTHSRIRGQYCEVRDALLRLKDKYRSQKARNNLLSCQVTALRRVINRQFTAHIDKNLKIEDLQDEVRYLTHQLERKDVELAAFTQYFTDTEEGSILDVAPYSDSGVGSSQP